MVNIGIMKINPYFFLIFLGSLPKWPKGTGLGPVEERLYAGSNPATTILFFILFFYSYFSTLYNKKTISMSSDKMSSEN